MGIPILVIQRLRRRLCCGAKNDAQNLPARVQMMGVKLRQAAGCVWPAPAYRRYPWARFISWAGICHDREQKTPFEPHMA